jgi:hypothetical protein
MEFFRARFVGTCANFFSFPQERSLQRGVQTKATLARQKIHFQHKRPGQLSPSHPAKHHLRFPGRDFEFAFAGSAAPGKPKQTMVV